jgi:trehalose synthase
MSTTEVAKPSAVLPVLEDYAAIVGEPEIIELRELARRLAGRHVKMVNSTAVGGGVAEILNRLVPLMEEVNVPTRWEVITGGEKFFHIT